MVAADIFLTGYLHVRNIVTKAKRYRLDSGNTLPVIQAGMATSTRVRGEARSFNVIEFDAPFCVSNASNLFQLTPVLYPQKRNVINRRLSAGSESTSTGDVSSLF